MTPTPPIDLPRLRFPDYSEPWKAQKVGDFIEEHREKSTQNNQHDVLTSSRVGLQRQSDYFGENRLTERDNKGFNVIPSGYITYRSRSDDRRFYFNENTLGTTGIISVYYPVFKIKNGSNKFFIELFRAKTHHIGRYSVGTSQTVLSLNDLRSIKLLLPDEGEQKEIAAFLEALDSKISLLTQKTKILEDYKKGCAQKLFSRELRFKDNQGNDFPDWVEKRLSQVVSFSKGKGVSKQDIAKDGKLPCIRYGEIYTTYQERIQEIQSRTNVAAADLTLSEAGDVIIPASGEDALDMARACCVEAEGVALGGDINILRGAENGVFLAYYLNNARKKDIARAAQGISVVHLYGPQLKTLCVSLPHSDEQEKIAGFLSAIDTKLSLVSGELELVQTFKKGLLQQMFI